MEELESPFVRWFPGCRLNYAQVILSRVSNNTGERPTIIYGGEGMPDEVWSGQRLLAEVARCQRGFKAHGLQAGDLVAIYGPNRPEAVAWTLAAASLGLLVTTISPDFGIPATLDRVSQTRPKLMLTAPRVFYNGRWHSLLDKAQEVASALGPIPLVCLSDPHSALGDSTFSDMPSSNGDMPSSNGDMPSFNGGIPPASILSYRDFGGSEIAPHENLEYVQLPFDHPLFVLYSSGTTGKPKCIVHSAGGTLLQQLKEHALHGNLGPTDRYLQFTTIGWMMWHWQLSSLAMGGAICLYDGSPFKPHPLALLDLVHRHQ